MNTPASNEGNTGKNKMFAQLRNRKQKIPLYHIMDGDAKEILRSTQIGGNGGHGYIMI